MNGQGIVVKLGRPRFEEQEDVIQKNGFSKRTNVWLKREAKAKKMTRTEYVRYIVEEWWMPEIEASRQDPVATPDEDKQFEVLISKSNHKSNHKKSKPKLNKE